MASAAGVPAAPAAGTMTFKIPTVINVSQTEAKSLGHFAPDEQMDKVTGSLAEAWPQARLMFPHSD